MASKTVRTFTLALALFLVSNVGSFLYGRNSAPIETQIKELVTYRTKVVRVASKQTKVRKETKTEVRPDGSKTVIEVVTDDSKIDSKENSDSSGQSEKITTVKTQRPNWNVSVMGTINHRRLLGAGQPLGYMYQTGVVGVGVHVQRRFVGPVYLGGYANTNGELGVSLGASF